MLGRMNALEMDDNTVVECRPIGWTPGTRLAIDILAHGDPGVELAEGNLEAVQRIAPGGGACRRPPGSPQPALAGIRPGVQDG